ncbi:hypothetical protein FF38_12780 [Lucilia cuprina]|uniref:Uncharacterized protein n=1 Tax=Lucilia cuprina TaxID=7375 RepID=A0A0L0CGJ8_LUCCU|nr:hypothetical protein CVS40_0514 [Lucilia cuprina]KNC31528.1 hypothetical protein FF38_12780 [Lucilia cuprina]
MRDNINNKISVFNKLIGLGEEVSANPFYTVPQNSKTNIEPKLDLYKTEETLENSTNNFKQTICKCPHCENMAKNFLYLESLIRTNYNASNNCNVCNSSLQYLQYVNKSIMKIFGNFDSIVEAAKAFGLNNIKSKTKLAKLSTKHAKRLTKSNHLSLKAQKVAATAKHHHHVKKMPSNVLNSSKKIQGSFIKNPIVSSKKNNKKKSKFKKDASNHSAVKTSIDGTIMKAVKGKRIKVLKTKTRNLLHKFKTKKND